MKIYYDDDQRTEPRQYHHAVLDRNQELIRKHALVLNASKVLQESRPMLQAVIEQVKAAVNEIVRLVTTFQTAFPAWMGYENAFRRASLRHWNPTSRARVKIHYGKRGG